MFLEIPLSDIFGILVAFSLFVYISLDGFDLGIGILIPWAKESERDAMIASVAPFWDANETWLVLAGVLILGAFPPAQGELFASMYIPTAVMLFGFLFRGAAFDFRLKGSPNCKRLWDYAFFGSSLIVSLAQGYMLGIFLNGGELTALAIVTSLLTIAAYGIIGVSWLILKTTEPMQTRLLKFGLYFILIGIGLISSSMYFLRDTWSFTSLEITCGIVGSLALITPILLYSFHFRFRNRMAWLPFVCTIILFAVAVIALAAHCYPWIIYRKMTLAESTADDASLRAILIGALIFLPLIILYHIAAHRIFKEKTRLSDHDRI